MTEHLNRHAPTALQAARAMAHQAVQLVTRAARANLPPAADDSHSNVGWHADLGGFLSQPIEKDGKQVHVGLGLQPLRLVVNVDGKGAATLDLAGKTVTDAATWMDGELAKLGLAAIADTQVPYDLPPEVGAVTAFQDEPELTSLAAWFALAHDTLSVFAAKNADLSPGPSPVRCWPHHFDIATYVALETGDPETARGIGVGMAPGDEAYAQPYFYVNPWPHLSPANLPAPISPGHWHTKGFVGAIATGEAVLSGDDARATVDGFLEGAFNVGKGLLMPGN